MSSAHLDVSIDTVDEELHGAKHLVVGRTSEGRHALVIFHACGNAAEAARQAHETAKNFPGKPVWIFECKEEVRAEVVAKGTPV